MGGMGVGELSSGAELAPLLAGGFDRLGVKGSRPMGSIIGSRPAGSVLLPGEDGLVGLVVAGASNIGASLPVFRGINPSRSGVVRGGVDSRGVTGVMSGSSKVLRGGGEYGFREGIGSKVSGGLLRGAVGLLRAGVGSAMGVGVPEGAKLVVQFPFAQLLPEQAVPQLPLPHGLHPQGLQASHEETA